MRYCTNNPADVPTFGLLERGDVVHIAGERGEFRFLDARVADDGTVRWVSFYGPIGNGSGALRSFVPDRVKVPTARALKRQRQTREA